MQMKEFPDMFVQSGDLCTGDKNQHMSKMLPTIFFLWSLVLIYQVMLAADTGKCLLYIFKSIVNILIHWRDFLKNKTLVILKMVQET